ncbi:MAG: hypothetical protein IKS19_04730 [Clostridia bacterium]|nr:hypothetical protein [Clostridia bacterium]
MKVKNNKNIAKSKRLKNKKPKETVDLVFDMPLDSSEKALSTKSNKWKKALGILLFIAGLSGILYFSDIGERSIKELEHQFSGRISTTDGYYVGDTDFGVFSGRGVLELDSGKSLSGIWNNGVLSGKVILEFEGLGKYEGDCIDSVRSGRGTFVWENGDFYEGEWSRDKINGTGVMTWADGSVYTGEFKNNKLSGEGILTFNDKHKYSGSFVDGKFEGIGLLEFANGDKYEGEWSSNQFSGDGVFKWNNGGSYTGSFSNNHFYGEGDLQIPNGAYLKGTFNNNVLIEGIGFIKNENASYTFTYKEGDVVNAEIEFADKSKYDGSYSDNTFNGNGVFTYKNGDSYTGNFKNGLRNGEGIYTWKESGAKYEGNWLNDNMNGHGVYYYTLIPGAYKLDGNFKDNKPEGKCTFYQTKTKSYITYWTDGKCTKLEE